MVGTERQPPKQKTQWSKKGRIRLMRYANVKKQSQDEKQNQKTTLITLKTLFPL